MITPILCKFKLNNLDKNMTTDPIKGIIIIITIKEWKIFLINS